MSFQGQTALASPYQLLLRHFSAGSLGKAAHSSNTPQTLCPGGTELERLEKRNFIFKHALDLGIALLSKSQKAGTLTYPWTYNNIIIKL